MPQRRRTNVRQGMSKRTVIVSGGELEKEFVLSVLKESNGSCIIAVDKGMEFLYENGIKPSYIVGDFDSVKEEVARYYREETTIPIREYNPEKDASDTEIAVRFAVALGCKEMLILGATGGRLDHLWANVQTLVIPFRAGIDARILDTENQIRLLGKETHIRKKDAFGKYFSVFPFGGEVYGFNITGARYPLRNHMLTPYDSLCVSNQIQDEEVVISFPAGIVILMETRDKEEEDK